MKVLDMTKNKAKIPSSTSNSTGDEQTKDSSEEVEKTAMSCNFTSKNQSKRCLNS